MRPTVSVIDHMTLIQLKYSEDDFMSINYPDEDKPHQFWPENYMMLSRGVGLQQVDFTVLAPGVNGIPHHIVIDHAVRTVA